MENKWDNHMENEMGIGIVHESFPPKDMNPLLLNGCFQK